ncbi:unnamed protein product [Cuscuta europaea]|uniref:VPS9 domain-containing protein n=1 Tax=Cuscuta europaea TaxID=41803 RepID=A0A9P1E7Y2_CUSEU|nr:unnamed protein product [Cuscuta europaea]
MYKAPRDKLVCILNCCKVITNLLLNASISENENPPGADDFLPVLIYVTIKANPPQLHSNLVYIQRFRRETRLVSEAAYYFTNVLSAESFIKNIDAVALSMDETEFESNMKSAQVLVYGLMVDSDNILGHNNQNSGEEALKQAMNTTKREAVVLQPEASETKARNDEQYVKNQPSTDKIPSISDLENKGAAMMMKEDNMSDFFQIFPYFFSQAGFLTVSDVEELLNNYKKLVLKYVCLSKGLNIAASPSPILFNHQEGQSQTQLETVKSPENVSTTEPNDGAYRDCQFTAASDNIDIPLLNAEDSQSRLAVEEDVESKDGENE